MKSAIGIGALLMDGLGDTIRVSLTEDPEYEIDPCQRLAKLGETAWGNSWGVAPFVEKNRDTHAFARRVGDLPLQLPGEEYDFRGLLHRDGTVFSSVALSDLKQADVLYKKLGAKLSVGMPFKDIATSDSIFMREIPPSSDAEGRRAIRRLQEVTVHVIVPADKLAADPLPGAVTLHTLRDAVAAHKAGGVKLPQGSTRLAISVDGTESEAEIGALKQLSPVVVLLNTDAASGSVSRVHASRRVFEAIKSHGITTPVIHHIVFSSSATYHRDELVIKTGSWVGGLLVDGLGDGALIEAPHEELEFLRTTSFGLLQGSRMRNTKTEYVSCPSCGRTLFNLQEVTEQIRQKTGHLPGVAIAVMGCIVNGPGEMADADFGYVGGAPGKIDLYVGKEVVKRAIPNDLACDELVQLIKDHGRWVEPEPAEPAAEMAMA
jgi:(E)-4-hydroxy-3-methylbut-2-enyl-diphosphate synthase